ncbi:energy transducer TonB [Bacteroides intestinalis]|jgi:protein TonB|uniref:Energy transducer TonB n=1 Tax=Bacteroides intestinalis TaxID=329854 RepID=A0AAQ0RSZ5_9BACE|nr:energy transducer TonB [Bacteroides intestinalis]QDO71197.1 energy transducer TonB [Bacteroides intestinalis]RGT52893.1 energy transducer TonB [Bacteroides intestinalis]RGX83233.1 energy transducer TonB [Bacteroides intestinalis]UCB35385.1 energy transducer TonB [Bacteroides intestinalis]UCB39628.1 energy transducer TonB [Bacteroides intestinalis]
METKKTPKANLENKRPTWLLVGYVTVLAFMFVAFEWTRDVRVDTSGRITENVFEQDMEIPLTRQPEVTPPPPPQVTPINDVLTIIDDDATAEETNFASLEETGEDVVIKHIPVTVDEEVVVEDDIFVVVEENPQFPNGGTAGLLQYLGKNIKYPTIPQENGTQGRVTVQFVVNKDGSIVDVKVIRGVDPYLDKEAVRVISTMPKWIPGKQRGVPVRCKFTVPVTFKLQ